MPVIVVLSLSTTQAALSWQDGVLIDKVGSGYIYIFPSTQGRVKANDEPAGKIQVGDTITVMYALKVIRSGKARFIALDGSKIPPSELDKLKPRLSVVQMDKQFGFLVKDKTSPKLNVYISPSFMAEKTSREGLKDKVARGGNLNVLIGGDGKLKVLKVILD